MKSFKALAPLALAGLATLAACGGGGGGGTVTPPTGGGGGGGPKPTPTPVPTASPGGTGMASVLGNPLANAKVVFTCGCSSQAGTATTDASGNFALPASSNAVPAAPNPSYTLVSGRNYLVVAADTSAHREAWTMLFLGNTPSTNVYMGSGAANTTDEFTAAASLYVFVNSPNNSDTSFDDWNFNTIAAWANALRSGKSHTAAETKLISDIKAAQTAGTTLFPFAPGWDPEGNMTNATIRGDLAAITPASDPAVPTPCPVSNGTPSCTGAPSP